MILMKSVGFLFRFAREPRWSETGDRYIIKLFRDYVFHQVDEHNNPVVNYSHVLTCLNKVRMLTSFSLTPIWLIEFSFLRVLHSWTLELTKKCCSSPGMNRVVWLSVTRRSSHASNRLLGASESHFSLPVAVLCSWVRK